MSSSQILLIHPFHLPDKLQLSCTRQIQHFVTLSTCGPPSHTRGDKKTQTYSGSLHPLQGFGPTLLSSFSEKTNMRCWFYLRNPRNRLLISHREKGSLIRNKKLTTRPHTLSLPLPQCREAHEEMVMGSHGMAGYKCTNALNS